jgi:hypothetical protein
MYHYDQKSTIFNDLFRKLPVLPGTFCAFFSKLQSKMGAAAPAAQTPSTSLTILMGIHVILSISWPIFSPARLCLSTHADQTNKNLCKRGSFALLRQRHH